LTLLPSGRCGPGLWRGEITLGYTGDGKRARRKVSGTTKAAVDPNQVWVIASGEVPRLAEYLRRLQP
jgi:hypothetical protein